MWQNGMHWQAVSDNDLLALDNDAIGYYNFSLVFMYLKWKLEQLLMLHVCVNLSCWLVNLPHSTKFDLK